ncbi:MAG: hypothetical protein AB7C97_04705 [Oscillospiraceae bacterium]
MEYRLTKAEHDDSALRESLKPQYKAGRQRKICRWCISPATETLGEHPRFAYPQQEGAGRKRNSRQKGGGKKPRLQVKQTDGGHKCARRPNYYLLFTCSSNLLLYCSISLLSGIIYNT